jgi:hypothetical protein
VQHHGEVGAPHHLAPTTCVGKIHQRFVPVAGGVGAGANINIVVLPGQGDKLLTPQPPFALALSHQLHYTLSWQSVRRATILWL